MILPFSTRFKNGNPTYFVDRIWTALVQYDPTISANTLAEYREAYEEKFGQGWDKELYTLDNPKMHTIREDENNRWKPGTMIHFVINNRSKNYFQFAPEVTCKQTQRVFMTPTRLTGAFEVSVGMRILTPFQISRFAINDGFYSSEHMEEYFFPAKSKHLEWSGKIIHWTNLTY